jgi:hypothetical protein
LNNVARHIRPFVVVAWACRRAARLAGDKDADRIPVDDLVDFVNRIEVIYAWSQILRNPEVELPGRQFLARLLRVESTIFGGPEWKKLCSSIGLDGAHRRYHLRPRPQGPRLGHAAR